MARVQLALYRGPGTTAAHRLAHALTVVVLTLRCLRWCPWSHAEPVVDALFFFDQNRCLHVAKKRDEAMAATEAAAQAPAA